MVGSTDIAAVLQAIQADLAELGARPSTALLQSFAERNQAELAAIKTTLRRLESDMANLVGGHASLLTSYQGLPGELRAIHDKLDRIDDLEGRVTRLEDKTTS